MTRLRCGLLLLWASLVLLIGPARAQVGVWETRAPFPLQATEVAAAAIGEKVYVVGGILPNLSSTNRLFVYDAFTDTWSEGAPLPIPGGVDHANVATLNGKFYFLGAIRISDGFTAGQTFEYDPATNRWTERAPMHTPRGASGVAALDGRIYVAGGLVGAVSVNHLEAYDPASNTWTRLAPMPTARDHLTAQAVGGKFYAISGRQSGVVLTVNEEYDPAANTWRFRARIPTARGGIGSGTLAGRIQVFGGEGPSGTLEGTFSQNEEYDPVADTWRALAPMPTPRHGLYGATVEGKRLFAPSGGPLAGAFFSRVHEAFFLPPASPPAVNAAGVFNAASFEPAVAPGALVSAFGANLSPGRQTAVRLPLPAQMNATAVLVNGVPAPLVFVSADQINFQVPPETLSPAALVVRHAGVESEPQPLPLAEAAPGIFTVSEDGRGQGAILHAGTPFLASLGRPAAAGDALEIFCTGLGASLTLTGMEVTIGGVRAEVLFVGNAPGFVGLNQVNVRMPKGVSSGVAVPVRLTYLGHVSNEVTIAAQ
ncbi:MAG: hypothetical protein HY647_10475 [Acidobacteria bacterium]|nr:hypothetical protein [Acidobacteriota bacterium]